MAAQGREEQQHTLLALLNTFSSRFLCLMLAIYAISVHWPVVTFWLGPAEQCFTIWAKSHLYSIKVCSHMKYEVGHTHTHIYTYTDVTPSTFLECGCCNATNVEWNRYRHRHLWPRKLFFWTCYANWNCVCVTLTIGQLFSLIKHFQHNIIFQLFTTSYYLHTGIETWLTM